MCRSVEQVGLRQQHLPSNGDDEMVWCFGWVRYEPSETYWVVRDDVLSVILGQISPVVKQTSGLVLTAPRGLYDRFGAHSPRIASEHQN